MSRTAKFYRRGTHRLLDPETTAARVRDAAIELGISRIAKVTGLDFIGIPVVMITRPTSRNLSVIQGKGLSEEAAFASGLVEALESYCSGSITGQARFFSRQEVIRERQCVVPEQMVRCDPSPNVKIPWTECVDMFGGPPKWFPSELVFADFSSPAPQGQGYFVTTTNGIAAGNSREEALLHGLCEVIERDAVALWMAARRAGRAGPPLKPSSLSGAGCLHLISLLDAAPIRFDIWDVTSDIDVPCFVCVIDDGHSGEDFSLGRIVGSGCHPCADVALCRAITEAAQARLTIIVGSRDDIGFDTYALMACNSLFARAFAAPERQQMVAFEDRSISTDDIADDLQIVLGRLQVCGIDMVVYSELPCPVEQISCVRVLAPQLEGVFEKPWYKPGNRAKTLMAAL